MKIFLEKFFEAFTGIYILNTLGKLTFVHKLFTIICLVFTNVNPVTPNSELLYDEMRETKGINIYINCI